MCRVVSACTDGVIRVSLTKSVSGFRNSGCLFRKRSSRFCGEQEGSERITNDELRITNELRIKKANSEKRFIFFIAMGVFHR